MKKHAILAKRAGQMVAQYRANGGGSNRTNWERLTVILTAVLIVVETGAEVEVTDAITDGTSPVYHQIHRILGTDLIRPYWHKVTVTTVKENGDTTTTGKAGTVRAYIVPTA